MFIYSSLGLFLCQKYLRCAVLFVQTRSSMCCTVCPDSIFDVLYCLSRLYSYSAGAVYVCSLVRAGTISCSSWCCLCLLSCPCRYDQLQWLLQEQSDVKSQHQLLLLNDKPFSSHLHAGVDHSSAASFPNTTPLAPVMLFSTRDHDITLTLPKTPSKSSVMHPSCYSQPGITI